MIHKRQDRAPFLLASLVVTVYVGVVARAQEPNLPPAGEPLVAGQHGPTIKAVLQRLRHRSRSET